jgi:hypothetical protein
MKFSRIAAAALLSAAAYAAHAAAPSYAGPLSSGTTLGSVAADSGPWATPEAWSLWRFSAPFAERVSFTVTPTAPETDLVIAVWYGLETDIAHYIDMSSGTLASTFVAGADAGGPGAAERLSFDNYYGAESFVLGIADFADGSGQGRLGLSIAAQVPEPGSWALMLGGLGLIAGCARRRMS